MRTTVFILTGVIVLVLASISARLYFALSRSEKEVKAGFQLQKDKVVTDLEFVFHGLIVLISGSTLFMVGAMKESSVLMSIGTLLGAPIQITLLRAFYRWSK
ncbi:MAG: hypothetical protein ABEJ93_04430 [Candidatus Nanohalobium sp.]